MRCWLVGILCASGLWSACGERASTNPDLASTADLAGADLAGADLASAIDQALADDLAVDDLATPPDQTTPSETDVSTASFDLTPPPDLKQPRDLWQATDLVVPPAQPLDVLFDARAMPTFYLTVPQQSWTTIQQCSDPPGKVMPPACDYQPATLVLTYDPTPGDADPSTVSTAPLTIGVRRKGRATWRTFERPAPGFTGNVADRIGKPSLKIKLENKLLGLTRLTLNNGVQDPSGLRERLGYRIMRALGEDAPLANSARVMVKGPDDSDFVDWGLYVNLQTLDKQFVKSHFGEVDGAIGNLYDTYNDWYFTDLDRCMSRDQAGFTVGAQEGRYELETNDDDDEIDTSDLTAAIDAVGENGCFPATANAAQLLTQIAPVLDVESFLRNAAIDAVLVNWDGFAGARNNYKLYHELRRDRFVPLPAGIDQTFAVFEGTYFPNWRYSLDHAHSRRTRSLFIRRCAADVATCWDQYLGQVEIAVGKLETLPLADEVATWAAQVRPYVDWTTAEFDRHVGFVEHHITHRAACVRAQLNGQPCAKLTCPTNTSCDATVSD